MSEELSVFPDKFVGWKMFRVSESSALAPPVAIMFDRDYSYLGDVPASCNNPHNSPHLNCVCGYNGFHSYETMFYNEHQQKNEACVVGIVSYWGEVFTYDHTFRAEYMRVEALIPDTCHFVEYLEIISQIAKKLSIPQLSLSNAYEYSKTLGINLQGFNDSSDYTEITKSHVSCYGLHPPDYQLSHDDKKGVMLSGRNDLFDDVSPWKLIDKENGVNYDQ